MIPTSQDNTALSLTQPSFWDTIMFWLTFRCKNCLKNSGKTNTSFYRKNYVVKDPSAV